MNLVSAPTEHDIALPGITLHYATWGQFTHADRTVLLVHGLTANHREWVELGPTLASQGWYVIAPDLRGRGLSAKPPHGYGLAFHAHDLLTLCDQLDLPTVSVVGHSLGAMITIYLSVIYPHRVSKAVLIDAGGKIPEDAAMAIAASLTRLGVVYPSLDTYIGMMRQAPMLQWNAFWEQYFLYDIQTREDGSVTSLVPKTAIDEEIAALSMMRTEDLPSFVRQPALLLRATLGTLGADRGFVLTKSEAERLGTLLPNCRVVDIPETNHYTIILSDFFTDTVTTFLAENV